MTIKIFNSNGETVSIKKYGSLEEAKKAMYFIERLLKDKHAFAALIY